MSERDLNELVRQFNSDEWRKPQSLATVEYREVGCGSHAWCVEQDGERIATFELAGGKKKADRVANAINRAERRSSPEPSAEAVESVAKAIHAARNGPMSYWHVDAERCGLSRALARAALAADPLRRELGELVERWSYRDDPVPRQELAALLEKYA